MVTQAKKNPTQTGAKKRVFPTFALGDAIIIIFFLVMGVVSSHKVLAVAERAEVVVIRDNRIVADYDLNTDGDYTIKGHEGPLSISIKNGTVSIVKAACRNQICVKTGKISMVSQQIICAPNHIVVEIRAGKGENAIDGIAR